ncbi:MAG: hypothetical protein HOV73_17890 [Streptomyces sp.]|nr:hypothetical protein [Streptomyces sp.]NUR41954.1 hypothetical protein [Streptomyces sp.]
MRGPRGDLIAVLDTATPARASSTATSGGDTVHLRRQLDWLAALFSESPA